MRGMTWALAMLIISTGGVGAARAATPTAAVAARPAGYEQALDLIHAYSGSGGELRLAGTIIDDLARTHPKSGYAQTLLAEALSTWRLAQDGTPVEVRDQVIALADEAIRLDPRLAQAYVAKARAQVRASRYDEARVAIERALALEPALSGALFLRADIYRRTGAFDAAEQWYTAFIDSTPSASRKGNGYGWIASMYKGAAERDPGQRERYVAKARHAYERGLELKPGGAWDNVNFAIFLNGYAADFDAAERYALRALSLMEFPMARYHLAAARLQKLWAEGAPRDRAGFDAALKEIETSSGLTLDEVRAFPNFDDVVRERLDELARRADQTQTQPSI